MNANGKTKERTRPKQPSEAYFYRSIMADADNKKAESDPPLEQATFEINDANSEEAHNAMRDAVKDLNGVHEVNFAGGGVIVTFNPIGITKEEICTALRRSGYRAPKFTAIPAMPGKGRGRRPMSEVGARLGRQ
jgi:hypothetical protein